MDMENILSNLVRIGTVSDVDNGNKKVRVIYKDRNNLVSGWLPVLQHNGAGVSVKYSSSGADGEHSHTASVTTWMPTVNDTVVVIYLPVFNADGFILGAI